MGNTPNIFLKWILWWQVDPYELKTQVRHDLHLPVFRSARKTSAVLMLASAALTLSLFFMGNARPESLWDAGILAFLSVFVFRGHRWALVAAMLFWTLIRAYYIVNMNANPIGQILWWTLYMNRFYLAYIVSREHNRD